ncbi:MAG: sugar transporter [Mucilaginibacter sp.]|uniref:sugar transporter n=1 Tax=Mucilaginibacter sp. TaxID=1882438 RepID=UPI0034E405AE
MKKLMMVALLLVAMIPKGKAQDIADVVKWDFYATKIAPKTYEVHMVPTVQQPWHIYSQVSPKNGAVPTRFTFAVNPIAQLQGNVKEIGKVASKYEQVFKLTVLFFEGKVDFVQVVKLRADVKTTLSGTVKFMVCNDHECLPPQNIPFKITVK